MDHIQKLPWGVSDVCNAGSLDLLLLHMKALARIALLIVVLLVAVGIDSGAVEPPALKSAPASPRSITNYFAIDKIYAPCCAVMLQHALTNISTVKTADVFVTNRIVRVVHQPDPGTLKKITLAFRGEIIAAKRLKAAPKVHLE
jgi:hypothetical protein